MCVYCKKNLTVETMTCDHLIPVSKGGTDRRKNLVPACTDCNFLRGNFLSIQEFESYSVKVRAILVVVDNLIRSLDIISKKVI